MPTASSLGKLAMGDGSSIAPGGGGAGGAQGSVSVVFGNKTGPGLVDSLLAPSSYSANPPTWVLVGGSAVIVGIVLWLMIRK